MSISPVNLESTPAPSQGQAYRNSYGVQDTSRGVSGYGRDEGGARPAAQRPAVSALPCQESHNCTGVGADTFKVRGSDLRVSHALITNVRELCDIAGVNRVGFLTLTTPDVCSYWERDGWGEAQGRFHSFMSHGYRDIFKGGRYVVVLEPQHRGAVHWHMVVECPADIRSGVNFEEFMRGDYGTAPASLRGLWGQLRERLQAYGMGRHELLPVRSERDAIAEYVGKYISKSITQEKAQGLIGGKSRPARCRRVRYSRGSWRAATANFAWAQAGRKWRQAVAYVSAELGLHSTEDWTARFGQRWCWVLGDMILSIYDKSHTLDARDGAFRREQGAGGVGGISPVIQPEEART